MTFYDEHPFDFARNIREWLWLNRLKRWLNNKVFYDKMLDLGCGTGILTELLSRFAGSVVALDKSARSIRICKDKVPGVIFLVDDLDKLKVEYWPVDIVFCMGVLHHTENGMENLKKFKAKKYVISVYHKGGRYWWLYKLFKGRKLWKHPWYQDMYMTPIVHFYDDDDIPECFEITYKKRLWFTPQTIYELRRV